MLSTVNPTCKLRPMSEYTAICAFEYGGCELTFNRNRLPLSSGQIH